MKFVHVKGETLGICVREVIASVCQMVFIRNAAFGCTNIDVAIYARVGMAATISKNRFRNRKKDYETISRLV